MSGLLRRIKRSRPAEAGEPTPEGRAADVEGGAATTAETPPTAPLGTAADTTFGRAAGDTLCCRAGAPGDRRRDGNEQPARRRAEALAPVPQA